MIAKYVTRVERLKNIRFFKIFELGLEYFTISTLSVLVLFGSISVVSARTPEAPFVTLDKESYPVPWGELADFAAAPNESSPAGRSIFPLHLTAQYSTGMGLDDPTKTLGNGNVIIYVQIHDSAQNKSPTKQDQISLAGLNGGNKLASHGPLKIYVSRGDQSILLATAGFEKPNDIAGRITLGTDIDEADNIQTRELGPITETETNSGIFEIAIPIRYTDGPVSKTCPEAASYVSATDNTRSEDRSVRFATSPGNHCILKADTITIEYTYVQDPDNFKTVSDSATFSLVPGKLEADQPSYIIGSGATLTMTDPDLDLDSRKAESYPLDLIEWDSAAATLTIGQKGRQIAKFLPEPTMFVETGPDTGKFQTVIEIPDTLNNESLQRGEEIMLEYTDWGAEGSYVGQDDEDISTFIYTSNFGASIGLDKEEYSASDTVKITVIDPNHNSDDDLIDEIGNTIDPLKISTMDDTTAYHTIEKYRLVETDVASGIFVGEVTLNDESTSGTGPNDGLIQLGGANRILVQYEFSPDETIVGSAAIQNVISDILPPLQQIKAGVPMDKIQCEEGLQLIIKSASGDYVCVNPESVTKLIARGWAKSI